MKYKNTINEKDRSKENILHQRRLTKQCLSFSDPDTEADEGLRVQRITMVIDQKVKDYPILAILRQFVGEWYLETGFWPTIPDWTFEARALPWATITEDPSGESQYSHSYSGVEGSSREPPQPRSLNPRSATEPEDDRTSDKRRSRSDMELRRNNVQFNPPSWYVREESKR